MESVPSPVSWCSFLDTALAIAGLLMDKVYQEACRNEAHGQNDWADRTHQHTTCDNCSHNVNAIRGISNAKSITSSLQSFSDLISLFLEDWPNNYSRFSTLNYTKGHSINKRVRLLCCFMLHQKNRPNVGLSTPRTDQWVLDCLQLRQVVLTRVPTVVVTFQTSVYYVYIQNLCVSVIIYVCILEYALHVLYVAT